MTLKMKLFINQIWAVKCFPFSLSYSATRHASAKCLLLQREWSDWYGCEMAGKSVQLSGNKAESIQIPDYLHIP